MSVTPHVRAFLAGLDHAPTWRPEALASSLVAAPGVADWAAVTDALRVGHGAIALHERHLGALPGPTLPGVQPSEALLIGVAGLRAAALDAPGDALLASVDLAPTWLANLLRMEPDFFDQLLLASAIRYARDAPFRDRVQAQLAALHEQAPALHEQASSVLGSRRTLSSVLRGLVRAGPDLARSPWVRWTRAVLVLHLLHGKG